MILSLGVKIVVIEYYVDKGVFLIINVLVGFVGVLLISGKYVISVIVGIGGVIIVMMKGLGLVSFKVVGKIFVLILVDVGGLIIWDCKSFGIIDVKYCLLFCC